MSLNKVVSNLVRAAVGIPADISDADLDRHVAELLAAEAKVKEKSWSELGLSAFLGDGRDSADASLPRTNKRFLASVIRTVDGHNSALLRTQAQAAKEVRVGRGESSRSGASRLFGGAMRNVGRERDDRESTYERRRRREYDDEVGVRRRIDGRSERDLRDDRGHDDRRKDEKRRSLDCNDEKRRDRFNHEERRHRDTKRISDHSRHTRSPSRSAPSPSDIPAPAPLSPPAPAPAPLSKMDRYFSREYDPRLDLGEVPKEGFIGEVGWDNMLAILKERGKKRRHHSPTLSDDPLDIPVGSAVRASSPRRIARPRLEEKKRRKRRGGSDESEDERERVKRKEKRRREKEREKALTTAEAGTGDGKGMFDMAYVKKGSVREWDVGK